MSTVRKFRWFWPWQDEQEETWLGALASQGLHLLRLGYLGQYWFESGAPREMVYRLDYRSPAQKDRDDYLRLFSDAGWEYIGQMSSWQYFRKPVQVGEAAEIFTDVDSKIDKYRRVSTALLPFLVVWILILNSTHRQATTLGGISQAAGFLIIVLFLYILVSLLQRMGQLRKRKTPPKG